MTTFNTDVDSVCTHEELAAEVGGTVRLEELLSLQSAGDSREIRQRALRDVLKSLGGRTPPIFESDLSDVTELRDAVIYNALWRIYREAMTAAGDVHDVKQRQYHDLYKSEILSLRPTLAQSSVGAPFSFTVTRR